ncbi:MAG: hypothetical protein HOW73_27185 [Polyangiaceae bacterium]|nr:hypothetical protein [Polyangiaceae bacterium]
MKITRSAPLTKRATDPSVCDQGSFPDYMLEVGPYPANPDPFVRNLFPGERQQPTWLGQTIDKGGNAILHNMGVLDGTEVAGTCEARVILSAAQGHSLFDATLQIRVENGAIQGKGNWAWGTDLPEGVEECPPGGCTCSVDVDVTGAIVFPG